MRNATAATTALLCASGLFLAGCTGSVTGTDTDDGTYSSVDTYVPSDPDNDLLDTQSGAMLIGTGSSLSSRGMEGATGTYEDL